MAGSVEPSVEPLGRLQVRLHSPESCPGPKGAEGPWLEKGLDRWSGKPSILRRYRVTINDEQGDRLSTVAGGSKCWRFDRKPVPHRGQAPERSANVTKLPHPTRWRFNLTLFGSAFVGIAFGILGAGHSPHSTWCLLGAAPFLLTAVASIPFWNYTRCPACGKVLSRARRTSNFNCLTCSIEWTCRDFTN